MRNTLELSHNAMLALTRVATEAGAEEGPEQALWTVTRTLPALLGDRSAALVPGAFRDDPPPAVTRACAAFLRMPDGRHHMIAAPVNFPATQHHELVDIKLGHPGHVAQTRRSLVLHDTALHASFVKILQAFRAGSTVFTPMLWKDAYLGVIICASAIRGTFDERDLAAQTAFSGLAASLFIAHGGPAWLATIDTSALPVRNIGN